MAEAKTARKKTAKKRVAKKRVAKKGGRKAPRSFARYEKLLHEKRQEMMDLYEHDLRAGQDVRDEGAEDLVDRANSSYNREFMLSLSSGERNNLFEIEDALGRIETGDYGSCPQCKDTIPAVRLRAIPWARYCIDCQEKVEQGLIVDAN